jgi:hypothetical protein
VVGVGGGVLDIGGAIRADLIVSLDASPAIRDWFIFATAMFAHVDQRAKAEGWDDERAAREVQRLLDPSWSEAADTKTELQAALAPRVPEDVRGRLRQLIDAVQHRATERRHPAAPVPTHWFRTDDAVGTITHLRKLAREGKIYYVTSTIEAPGLIEGIGNIIRWHRTEASAVNMSNAYEYMPDSRPAFEAFGRLPLRDDAKLFMVSGHVQGALSQGGAFDAKEAELVGELGNIMTGAVVPAKEWLGPAGKGQQVEALRWKAPSCVQMMVWGSMGAELEALGEAWLASNNVRVPTNPEELAALKSRLQEALARRSF